MVTVLQGDDSWFKAGQEAANTFNKSYNNRADEMALQKAVSDLPENASMRDRLNAITKVRTYDPQSKQTLLSNLMGVEQFEEAKRAHQASEDINKKRYDYEKEKQTEKDKEALGKKLMEKAGSIAMLKESELPKEQKDDLQKQIESDLLDRKALEKIVKPEKKEKDQFEEGMAKEAVKEYVKSKEALDSANNSLINLDRINELAQETSGLFNYAKSQLPFGKKAAQAAELDALGFTAIQPVVKIFNPSGPIAQRKLEQLSTKFAIKSSDYLPVIKGKTAALKRYATQSKELAIQKMELIKKYKGQIPTEELVALDEKWNAIADQSLSDIETIEKQVDPSVVPFEVGKMKGKTVSDPKTGVKYVSDGVSWRKV